MTADIELNFGKPIPKAEPGSYPAMLVAIEPFVINEGTADQKTLIRWEFSLDGLEDPEQPGSALILDCVTSTATGERSKMRPLVVALMGKAPDDRLNLSALREQAVGRECLVTVEINDAGYSKVSTVARAIRRPATPPAPAPVEAPGESIAKAQPGEFSGVPTQAQEAATADLPF